MARPVEVTSEEREQIRALLAEGKGRNNIAKRVGRSRDTVSRIAAEYGHVFGQTAEQNTHARRAYCADARERLRLGLYAEAERLLAKVRQPQTVFQFVVEGGQFDKAGRFMQHELEEPEPKAVRELLTAMGIAIDKAEMIEKNNNAGTDDGRGAMLALLEAMGVTMPEGGTK